MSEVSIDNFWMAIRRKRALIAATTIAGLLLAGAAAWFTTPVYRVEVLLAPVEADSRAGLPTLNGRFSGLAALTGVELGAISDRKDESIALLRSRALAMSFIEERQLLPVLFANDWDGARGSWESRDPEDVPTLWDAYRRFDDEIRSVTEDPKSGLVTLAIEWTDAQQAKAWADELVARANSETRARATREAERSLKYLDEQLQRTDLVELRQAIFALMESQTKQMMFANVREDYAFTIIDPPVVPDADDPVRPRTPLLLTLGAAAGLLLGLLIALLAGARTGFGEPG